MERVLGIAEYMAVRSPGSSRVTLTATGILPCYNYSAKLEMDPRRIFPPIWDMVFYIEPICLRAIKPFQISIETVAPEGFNEVSVEDRTGLVRVPIADPFVPVDIFSESSGLEEQFVVYARLPAASEKLGAHKGCIIVPAGSIVPAIYYRAFGPASKEACEEWLVENCGLFQSTGRGMFGGDVPWPKVPEELA